MKVHALFLLMGLSTAFALISPLKAGVSKLAWSRTGGLLGGVAAVGAAAAILGRNRAQEPYTPAPGSLKGQTILITGATTGLGLESAKRLASGGAEVILTARDAQKGAAAVTLVKYYLRDRGIDNDKISFVVVDLDNLEGIRQAVPSWTQIEKIDVLLNNAGIMALPERSLTVDGIEKQVQSNHLGHFLLTALLADKLADDARIVNVSSEAHKIATSGLDFDYMWTADTGYGAWRSYGQSKLANVLFTQELQRRALDAGLDWTVACLHPGVVGTDLARNMMGEENYNKLKKGEAGFVQTTLSRTMNAFLKTPEEGATTQIWLASRAEGDKDVRGQYLSDCKVRNVKESVISKRDAERLWTESEELARIKFVMPQKKPVLVD